jgi:hypothetical protein
MSHFPEIDANGSKLPEKEQNHIHDLVHFGGFGPSKLWAKKKSKSGTRWVATSRKRRKGETGENGGE